MAKAGMRRSKRPQTKMTCAIRSEEGKNTLTRHWRSTFLAALAETSNITQSAAKAKISPARAYKVRREEPEFAREWFAALCEGYDHLEMDVLRRLREGDFQTADGSKYDFANAMRILSAHRETIGKQRAVDDYEHEDEILASINARLDAMRERTRDLPDLLEDHSRLKGAATDGV